MKHIYLPFRYKQIKDKYLVTNDYFDWLFLSENELEQLKNRKIEKNSEFYNKLADNNFIIDKEHPTTKNISQRKSEQLSHVFLGPSLHIIVLTKRCNHKCTYCHAASTTTNDKEQFDLTKENAKKFVDIIMNSPNPACTIEFQGGEPLLNFEMLKYIYEYATELNKKAKKGLHFSIVTNLEAMGDEKFDFLTKNNIGVCTSLDGHKELHDKNRESMCFESSHDNVTKWMDKYNNEKRRMGALVTVSRESLKYPKEIIDEYVRLGYPTIHLRYLNYLGKAIGTWKNIGYTAEEFIDFWKKAVDYLIEINKKGTFISERTCNIILKKIINKKEPYYLDLMSPCGAIIGQLAYNYDGKIFTCDEGRTIGEDIFQVGDQDSKSIKNIISQDKSVEILSCTSNDSYYCEYCAYKPYCGVCPVCNYQETGNPICDVLRTGRCKIFMAIFDYLFEKLQDEETRKILESWVDQNVYKKKKVFD